jgi:ParB-like chromosome segregation protein Spo0J
MDKKLKRKLIEIEVDRIRPNLRLIYTRETIERVRQYLESGVEVEPLEIWFDGECYRIWDGEKRWRVCKILGVKRVKAYVIEFGP